MRMRRLLLLALAAAVVTIAGTAVSAGANATSRPFKGTITGFATFPADPGCPIGLRTVADGSGTASHLGLVSMTSSHCTPATDQLTGGQMTLVAANGDELYLTYSGTSGPLPPVGGVINAPTHNVIVGGTGRFADATGEADFTALVTFAGFGVPVWPVTWTWDGTISY